MKKVIALTMAILTVALSCATTVSANNDVHIDKQEYIAYNMETKELTYSYFDKEPPAHLRGKTLSQEAFVGTDYLETQQNTVSPRIVIGNDDREETYNIAMPYRAICYMSVTFPNGESYRGTAWLFQEYGAVTAAHCIYNPERGGWASTVTLYPARKDDYMPCTGTVIDMGIATPYYENQDNEYDYALLKIQENLGYTVGRLGFAYNAGAVNDSVRVIGYPSEVEGYARPLYRQFEATGRVLAVTNNRIYYNADMTPGQSGGPVMLAPTATVIAVNTHQNASTNQNIGKRIHYDMYEWMLEW